MRTGKALLVALAALLVMAGAAGSALAWGNAPTHLSIANDLIEKKGISVNDADVFIGAAVCPDLGKLELFRYKGWGFLHSLAFAEAMREVALDNQMTHPEWLDTANAWGGAHLAADEVGHEYIKDADETEHNLFELAVDTCIFYGGSPLGTDPLNWENVNQNLNTNCCDPELIFLASEGFCPNDERLELKSLVPFALEMLKTQIALEYAYIKAKKNDRLSKWWLRVNDYGSWPRAYRKSVNAAYRWIR